MSTFQLVLIGTMGATTTTTSRWCSPNASTPAASHSQCCNATIRSLERTVGR